MEKEKLCLRCMRRIGDNTVCPYCRNESSEPQANPYLPLKTVIGGKYLIGKMVGNNSEGTTYYGFDLENKTPVTIRELYPEGMLTRGDGNYCLVNVGKASEFIDIKEDFLKLWRAVASLKGYTALTNVYAIVEDLGTVYVISEYLGEGQSLREYLLETEQGYISWDDARVLFMPVVSALNELHEAGVIHGGISPTTLVIDTKGKLRITGYCIEAVRREKSGMTSELFDGYAAVEQYGFSSGLTESTDVYAFAAVLYRTLIGSVPMSASSRLTNDKLMIPGKFAEMLPAYVINALVNALQILPEERTLNVEQLRDELSASPAAAGSASLYSSNNETEEDDGDDEYEEYKEYDEDYDDEDASDEVDNPQKLRKSTIAAFVVSVILCLAILITVLVGINRNSQGEEETSTTENTAAFVEKTEKESETTGDVVSIKVPDFKGKLFEDVKTDENYRKVLSFNTEYVDSEEDKGTIISQDIAPGTSILSVEGKKEITIKVSNGLKVPDVEGKKMNEAIAALNDAGFNNVKTVAGNVANKASDSLVVYRVVYEKEGSDDWSAIPSDGRLSAGDSILVYYYGEYSDESTTESSTTTQPQSTQPQSTTTTEDQSTTTENQTVTSSDEVTPVG